MILPIVNANQLLKQMQTSGKDYLVFARHGTLEGGFYKPDKVDPQSPHRQDEVYIVVSGSGKFFYNGELCSCQAGDFIFVPAGIEHRFIDFTDDFATWVIFYGPPGGEATQR